MTGFEWQTEEEDGRWADVEEWSPEPSPERGSHRRWLALLLILVAVGATLVFFYRQVNERVEDATADVKLEVLASHDLVRYAAEQRDPEVLVTFLSGRDPAWSQVQQQLAENGTLFDRRDLGLELLPAGPPERSALGDRRQVISVTVSPELTEATVTVAQAYAVQVGNGITEAVYLQQEGLYRRGEDRWLYSPPEEETTNTQYEEETGSYLSVHYEEGERDIARRLAADLDRKVGELCNLPDTTCAPGYHIHVVFERAPESLGQLDPAVVLQDSRLLDGQQVQTIALPAPSLVGLPVDEAAYRAVYRGYAAQVLRAVLTWQAWPWECCDHVPVFQALMDQQLVQLGVQVSPLDGDDYQALVEQNFALLEDTMLSWYGRQFVAPGTRAWTEGQAVVEFLLAQKPQVSLAQMAGQLNEAPNFWFWTYAFLDDRISDGDLTRAWIQFAYRRAGLAHGAPPGSWPSSEALLLCGAEYAANQRLYRYDPNENALVSLVSDRAFLDLQPLPGAEGALLVAAEGTGNEREIQLSLWQEGTLTPLWNSRETNVSLSYSWSALDAAGQQLTMAVESREGETHILLDLAGCQDGACRAKVLPGQLIWSPDGNHSLILQERQLLLADGQGNIIRPVIEGTPVTSVLWLDDDTYGYVRRAEGERGGPPAAQLVAETVEEGKPRALLTVDELAYFLPLGPEVYNLSAVVVNPANPERLLLQVIDYTSSSSAADLFQWDRRTGEIWHLFATDSWWAPVVAPDGKWLAMHRFARALGQSGVLLYEFESGQELLLPQLETSVFAWSPDGRWLLSSGGSLLQLVAPDDNYRRVLAHGEPGCGAVAWVN